MAFRLHKLASVHMAVWGQAVAVELVGVSLYAYRRRTQLMLDTLPLDRGCMAAGWCSYFGMHGPAAAVGSCGGFVLLTLFGEGMTEQGR
jgi:hypothetical protein